MTDFFPLLSRIFQFFQKKLPFLLFAFILQLSISPSYAQHTPSKLPIITTLSPIIITGSRFFKDINRNAQNTIVYTSKEIQKIPANNLSEILNILPDVDIQANSQFGQSSSVSIQGSESYHVLVLVDGIPFNTQLSGQANPTRIPIDNIKQIEILKGAASSSWGSSLGGVINVITKDVGTTKIPSGSFTTSFAEFSTLKHNFDISGKIGDVGYLLTGSSMQTDGIKSKSNVHEMKIFSKWAYPLTEISTLTASFGYSGAHVLDGVNTNNRWQSKPYISRYGKLNMHTQKNTLTFDIGYKYNDQDITSDTYNASTGNLTSSAVSNNVYQGINLKGNIPINDDILAFGIDIDKHTLKSSNYLDTSKSIFIQAPYLNYSLRLNQWDINTELRYDNNNQFGSQMNPSLGAVYHFKKFPKTTIRGKISRAFNAPALLWIYNDDASLLVAPNPDLEAEHAIVYELGGRTQIFSSMDIKINLYRSDIKNAIATVFRNGLYLKNNFKKFRRQGISLSAKYKINKFLNIYGTGAFNDVENRITKKTVRDQGIARQSFTLGANYINKHGLSLNIYGYYNYWSSSPSNQANDQKFIFDTRITQTIKNIRKNIDIELFINIYNLTNSKYWSSITFPLPKRYFEGGFKILF